MYLTELTINVENDSMGDIFARHKVIRKHFLPFVCLLIHSHFTFIRILIHIRKIILIHISLLNLEILCTNVHC